MTIDRELLAGLAGGLAVFAVFAAAYQLMEARYWGRRMNRFIAPVMRAGAIPHEAARAKQNPEVVEAMNRRLGRLSFAPRIRLSLIRAGMKMTVQQWILIRIGAIVGGVTLGLLVGRTEDPLTAVLTLGFLGAAGFYAPLFVLSTKQKRRARKIETQLSDTIDIMAGSLEAGSSLPQSLMLVSREMPPPITEEFGRAVRQVELGLSLEEALEEMTERVRSDELAMLVSAVNIQYRVGGNLARVLRTIGTTIRERVRIKGEISVLTSQQRLSGYVIGLLPFGLGTALYLMNPQYMGRLLEPGITRLMAMLALVMMIAGFLILRKVVDIEV